MPTLSSNDRFLGVDLGALWREIRRPWSRLHEWPVMSWLTPPVPIRLLQADGGESVWLGEVLQASSKSSGQSFVAVELPLDDVLCRSLVLPQVPDDEVAGAVALEAQGASPFPAADLVWGFRLSPREGGGREAQIVLASRRQIEHYLGNQSTRLSPDQQPELWVRIDTGAPVVLAGYGEGARVRFASRRRHLAYGLLASAVLLALASAVTPVLQLRMRALEADRAYEDAQRRTKVLVKQREALLQSAEQVSALHDLLGSQVDFMRVFERLTALLPDDTYILALKYQGGKFNVTGQTANSSTVMQALGGQSGFKEVRAPSPATRVGGANNKETFIIEFAVDLEQFGIAAAPSNALPAGAAAAASSAAPVSGAAPLVTAVQTPPASVSAPAAPPATTPPKLVAPKPAAVPAGKGPTFGGSPTIPAPVPPTPKTP